MTRPQSGHSPTDSRSNWILDYLSMIAYCFYRIGSFKTVPTSKCTITLHFKYFISTGCEIVEKKLYFTIDN